MRKRWKILIIAAAVATILTLSIVSVVAAAGPNNPGDSSICCGMGVGFGVRDACSDAVCQLLGLTPEQIHAQRFEGKSLVQIAATRGVSEQQLIETIMNTRKAEIQARVTAGSLTREQANLMVQKMEQNVVRAINRTSIGSPEWAGTGNGRSIDQKSRENGYGEPGLGTGPGNMHRWGKGSL